MPAIITHDQFGHDLYRRLSEFIGASRDEMDAFLLGNQGPDPLFYSVANPRLKTVHRLGGTMHHQKPNELLAAFRRGIDALPDVSPAPGAPSDRAVGRAYALGFLGHYLLDSHMHPLVYFYEYGLCDAGVPGLTRADGHEVHAVIESELDEMVLYARRSRTIATFNPATEILRGSDRMLGVASRLHAYAARTVYGIAAPEHAFALSVKQFRAVQGLFYSPTGMKRRMLGALEERFRRYSFYRSMSHRAVAATTCAYDNRAHEAWRNPFTDEASHASFWDVYDAAQTIADDAFALFDSPTFDAAAARAITDDLNFSGQPTTARIIAVE